MWATFFSGEPQAGKLAEFFRAAEKPLLAQCSPEHVCSTGIQADMTGSMYCPAMLFMPNCLNSEVMVRRL